MREVTRLGHPLRGWWQYATLAGGGFAAVAGVVRGMDPSYVTDFWTAKGCEGTEPAVRGARIQQETAVTAMEGKTGLVLTRVPAGDLVGADLRIVSGPQVGETLQIASVIGTTVTLAAEAAIPAGTRVQLDNSWLIAMQYYHRHQLPGTDQYGWNQYRAADGTPLYPQRAKLTGPMMAASSAGSVPSGKFHGKMIMVESVLDVSAYPWSGDWYRRRAQAARAGGIEGDYRLWYMVHADHGPDLAGYESGVGFKGVPGAANHIVGYLGTVQQALLDLDLWVTKGVAPPAGSGYRIDADSQVQLAATAAGRGAVQPVVTLSVGTGGVRGQRVEAAAGQPVTLAVTAQVPPGAGKIVKVEWDLEGTGKFADVSPLKRAEAAIKFSRTHVFARAGNFFPVVRVTAERAGKMSSRYGLVENIAGARVIVR